jgi:hypothetical protein
MLLCRNGQAQDLADKKAELERHVWGTFVEGRASVALGATGVVVSGCEACRKRFGTNSQYLRHLADDVLPFCSHPIENVVRSVSIDFAQYLGIWDIIGLRDPHAS